MESLVLNHPFVDGNKRTGITAAGLLLQLNGERLVASNAELESFTFQVFRSELTLQEIASWLRRYSHGVDSGSG